MLLDDLATHLQAAGLGTIGTTLFKGTLPMDPTPLASLDAIVALIETPGFPPVRSHDQPPSLYEQPVVQVLSRGVPHGYVGARQKAQAAWEALDGVSNQTLGTGFYLWIVAQRSPAWLRTDDLHRPVIEFAVRCARSGVRIPVWRWS